MEPPAKLPRLERLDALQFKLRLTKLIASGCEDPLRKFIRAHRPTVEQLNACYFDTCEYFSRSASSVWLAVYHGNGLAVSALLDFGADHLKTGPDGNSPVALAVWRNDPISIKALLEHGADPLKMNRIPDGKSVVLIEWENEYWTLQLLELAVYLGFRMAVQTILRCVDAHLLPALWTDRLLFLVLARDKLGIVDDLVRSGWHPGTDRSQVYAQGSKSRQMLERMIQLGGNIKLRDVFDAICECAASERPAPWRDEYFWSCYANLNPDDTATLEERMQDTISRHAIPRLARPLALEIFADIFRQAERNRVNTLDWTVRWSKDWRHAGENVILAPDVDASHKGSAIRLMLAATLQPQSPLKPSLAGQWMYDQRMWRRVAEFI